MRKRYPSWLIGLVVVFSMFCSLGCVSEKIEPEHNPKLGVAQSSDGWLTFRLETELGYKYQILYRDSASNQWKAVKGCESIRGTGDAVEIRKKFNSRQTIPPFSVTYSKI